MNEFIAHLFELIGATFEVTGGLYLANRYMNRPLLIDIPFGLISALWGGKSAENLAFLSETSDERALNSLKGILFLIIGFMLRAVPHIFYVAEYLLNDILSGR